jgi:hypothetical protein
VNTTSGVVPDGPPTRPPWDGFDILGHAALTLGIAGIVLACGAALLFTVGSRTRAAEALQRYTVPLIGVPVVLGVVGFALAVVFLA